MTTDAVWPIPNPRSLSRRCAGLDGGGGGGRESVWDQSALLRTMRGNTPAVARVTRAFLEDCPRVVQRLRDALRERDQVTLQRLAHRIKGNAGILRAGSVRDVAERLEREAERGELERAKAHLLTLEQCLARLCEALTTFLVQAEGPEDP